MKLWCNITRGENIESRHEVYALAIDEEDKIIFSTGNPDYSTCIRSSLKPFQASAAILEGATELAGFTNEEIALMCASHNGEEINVPVIWANAERWTSVQSQGYLRDAKGKLLVPLILLNRTTMTPYENLPNNKLTTELSENQRLEDFDFGFTTEKRVSDVFGYNWPYDDFSIVEAVKIDIEFEVEE